MAVRAGDGGYPIHDHEALFAAMRHDSDVDLYVVDSISVVGGRSRRLCGAGIDAVSEIAVAAANVDPVSCSRLQPVVAAFRSIFPADFDVSP